MWRGVLEQSNSRSKDLGLDELVADNSVASAPYNGDDLEMKRFTMEFLSHYCRF